MNFTDELDSTCDIKNGECVNPHHLHNDKQQSRPQKEAASAPIIPPNTALRDEIKTRLDWIRQSLPSELAGNIEQAIDEILALIQDNLTEITIWVCPICKKYDHSLTKETLAEPEHIPYRGIDLGSCDGKMVKITIPLKEEEKTL